MNIEGSKLVSVFQAGAPAEGPGQSLSDSGASLGGFADVLTGQMASLVEAKVQGELLGQYKIPVEAQHSNPLAGYAEFLGARGDQPLVQLPTNSPEIKTLSGEGPEIKGEDSDRADTVLVSPLPQNTGTEKIADPLVPKVHEAPGDPSSEDVSLSETVALPFQPHSPKQIKEINNEEYTVNKDVDVKSVREGALTDLVEEPRQKIGEIVTAAHAESRKASRQNSESEAEDLVQVVSVMSPLPAVSAPMNEEEVKADDSANEAGHKNAPQSFVKPVFEEFKPTVSGATEATEEIPQQDRVFGQIIKESQYLNQNRSESPLHSDGLNPAESRPSVSDMDKALPRGLAEIAQLNRQPVENKLEMPAMTKPLAHPDWSQDLGERIVWMNNKELSAAEIKLNPQHLGPISVRIEMNDDQATIAFTANHAAVRDALEASIPKLREMMNSQQLNLADVNISQNNSSGQQHQSPFQQSSRHFDNYARTSGGKAESGENIESPAVVVGKGLLNLYA
jgi:flagellar hook-length control protein FliK